MFEYGQFFCTIFKVGSSVDRVGFLTGNRAYATTDDGRYTIFVINSTDDVDVLCRLILQKHRNGVMVCDTVALAEHLCFKPSLGKSLMANVLS